MLKLLKQTFTSIPFLILTFIKISVIHDSRILILENMKHLLRFCVSLLMTPSGSAHVEQVVL